MSIVEEAVEVLRAGGLVGMPTETVYGLAGDACNDDAVRRIFAVKGRPAGHPLIVHLAGAEAITDWAASVPPAAQVLAAACWPGPLTVLVAAADRVSRLVTGGRDTVGLRVPAHPVALELLERFGGGVAAPSANRFGHVSPTTAQHVLADLGTDVDLVLDGGPCPVGVESTIVDCTTPVPQILRPGGIPNEHISALLGGDLHQARGPSRAPGMLASHYAPRATVILAESAGDAERLLVAHPGACLLDGTADLPAYAQRLYTMLRDADASGASTVIAVMPPPAGLGHAIRDRLTKAAAGRTC